MRTYQQHHHAQGLARLAVALVLCGATSGRVDALDGAEKDTHPTNTTSQRINGLIADLANPDYAKRSAATRALCGLGAEARDELQIAAVGKNVEIALRAKRILDIIDRLFFQGTELRLEPSQTEIAWNEPVRLTLTMDNKSRYAARVPFQRAEFPTADAGQVGRMLDAGDWLHVAREDGSPVSMRVDDIAADAQVHAVVQARLDGGPTSTVAQGTSMRIVLDEFNRGWARYSLLDSGTYTVWFDYTPEWDDEQLARDLVGRVVSNKVSITVTKPAPESVSRHGQVASLEVTQTDSGYSAAIINHTDQRVTLNLNFGFSPPFAQGRWILKDAAQLIQSPVSEAAPGWSAFAKDKLHTLSPGKELPIATISSEKVLDMLQAGDEKLAWQAPVLLFEYSNLFDRSWQQRESANLRNTNGVPAILRGLLPRRLLATRLRSNEIELPWKP